LTKQHLKKEKKQIFFIIFFPFDKIYYFLSKIFPFQFRNFQFIFLMLCSNASKVGFHFRKCFLEVWGSGLMKLISSSEFLKMQIVSKVNHPERAV